MKIESPFVWYAEHPTDGELILSINPDRQWKRGYIYCPRIIRERLKPEQRNALSWLELALGPVGYIPQALYEEAGFPVLLPLDLRLIAMMDAYNPDPEHTVPPAHDQKLTEFILGSWASRKSG